MWNSGVARFGLVLILLGLASADWIRAIDYVTARSAAVSKCEAIDSAAYASGLYFNPAGYRSYYLRSECFQAAAVQFRDESLCAEVRERRSMFFSSWGYSPSQCRKLVAEGVAADHSALEDIKRLYSRGAVQLRAFQIEPNGNGRDFDIVPLFSGGYAHSYLLTFEILDARNTGGACPSSLLRLLPRLPLQPPDLRAAGGHPQTFFGFRVESSIPGTGNSGSRGWHWRIDRLLERRVHRARVPHP